MKHKIHLTESDLHIIVKNTIRKILKESKFSDISGLYNNIYVNDEIFDVKIDESEPMIQIGDYTLYDEEAERAISTIKAFMQHSKNGIENAIGQFIYEEMR